MRFRRTDRAWLPYILVSVHYMISWQPEYFDRLRWYMALGLVLPACLLHKMARPGPVGANAVRLFGAICLLNLTGAVLGIMRTPSLANALDKTGALVVSYATLGLILPVLTSLRARQCLLATLVFAALLWTLEIHNLVGVHGELRYATFSETGGNKNIVGLYFAMAGIVLLYIAACWQPVGRRSAILLRAAAAIGGIYFLYHIPMVYARSAILAASVGIISVVAVALIRSRKKGLALLTCGLLLAGISVATVVALPRIFQVATQWENIYIRTLPGGDGFVAREVLIRKGVYLIMQNPVIGVGAGGSLPAISEYPEALIHNSYLSDWAEFGILGLLSNAIAIIVYVYAMRHRFGQATLCDQIWLMLFIPLFVEMNFIEMNTMSLTMVAILGAILAHPGTLPRDLIPGDGPKARFAKNRARAR